MSRTQNKSSAHKYMKDSHLKSKKDNKEGAAINSVTPICQREAYKVMLKDYPDVLNIEQMCRVLGVSTKTGYRILKEGRIQNLKVGRSYRIPKIHILTYLGIGENT